MNATHLLNARQLALRLAALVPFERKALLAELPIDKQQELQQFIDEIEPAHADRSTFELAMAEIEMADSSADMSWDEPHLQLSLSGESFAVKQQLMDVFVHGKKSLVTPHVHVVIATYLQKKKATFPVESVVIKPWWKV